MKTHEKIAIEDGNMFGGKKPRLRTVNINTPAGSQPSLLDFIVPIISFLVGVGLCLIWSGGHTLFGGPHGILASLRHANSSLALAGGSLTALVISVLFLSGRGSVKAPQLPTLMKHGVQLMTPAMVILLLSWTLGTMLTQDLQTGHYLAHTLVGSLPLWLLPVMFFCVSGLTSFAMGSSWGTVAIVVPIAVPMLITLSGLAMPAALSQLPLLFPILGGILSGAVLGDHISPISDTTIMTATSTGSYHMDHVYTQFVYVAPVMVGTALSFIVAGLTCHYGLLTSSILTICSGILVSNGILLFLNTGSPTRPDLNERKDSSNASA